jgi:hypothetical protein
VRCKQLSVVGSHEHAIIYQVVSKFVVLTGINLDSHYPVVHGSGLHGDDPCLELSSMERINSYSECVWRFAVERRCDMEQ